MHVAMRIDFARSHAVETDSRVLALALASGVAGLAAYPTITLGNGTATEWMGRFEAISPRLTPAVLPDMSMRAGFRGPAQVADAAKTGAAGIFPTAASELAPVTGLSRLSVPEPVSGRFDGPHAPATRRQSKEPHLAYSAVPGQTAKTETPRSAQARTERGPAGPLDAVRIVLPPASPLGNTVGAMPGEPTLARVVPAQPPSPGQTSASEPQSLVTATAPQTLSGVSPGELPNTQPFTFSAPREVREFDLARLASSNPVTPGLARSSAEALASATVKSAPRTRSLAQAAKVPDRVVGDHILHVAGLSLEGVPSGNLSVRIGMSGDLSVKLVDLLAPVRDQMAPATFELLAGSAAAADYVSFAQLRAAGFDIRYDAGSDILMVSAQP